MRGSLVIVALLGLGACATAPDGSNTYDRQLAQLTSDCDDRDGMLIPTGSGSGIPATEYVCRIQGVSRN